MKEIIYSCMVVFGILACICLILSLIVGMTFLYSLEVAGTVFLVGTCCGIYASLYCRHE